MNAPLPQSAGLRPSDATLEILRTLVGFDTVSHRSNLGLIEWVRDRLARQGVSSRLTYDADKRKANLFATIGESRPAGLVPPGPTDVVPVQGPALTGQPIPLTEPDGLPHPAPRPPTPHVPPRTVGAVPA